MPDVQFFCDNDKSLLKSAMDPYFYQENLSYRTVLHEEWDTVNAVLSKYPSIFSEETRQPKNFYSTLARVCSRCFGWGLPQACMIPMIENLNHSDTDVTHEFVSKSMHTNPPAHPAYFTHSKYMNDYNFLYTRIELEDPSFAPTKGLLNKTNYEANNAKYCSFAEFKRVSAYR